MRAHGRLVEPEEFGDIVIQRTAADGRVVARQGRGPRGAGRGELRHAPALRRPRPAWASASSSCPPPTRSTCATASYKELERLAKQFPPGLEFKPGTDTTLAVRASISEVLHTLVEAIALVILVIFLFLHGWRSVLITALTLPVSLVGTFAFV